MAAQDNLSKQLFAGQRPMFMTASEIVKHANLSDAGNWGDDSTPVGTKKPADRKRREKNTLQQKLRESKVRTMGRPGDNPNPTLYESIKEEGVKTPVKMMSHHDKSLTLHDGHHRIAAQRNINRKSLIPISWY